ncbi:MAG: hypothetical protein Q9160_007271 [Pyrenula sp. 1 TL-2023]
MDAISFVLGIKSSHLRSTHLRDLVYRGRVLRTSKINEDGSATVNGDGAHANGDVNGEINGTQGTQERNDPKSAWVMAVYEDDAGDEQQWKRAITNQGVSEYRLNNQVVTAQQYNESLEAENILIKARNFLVFQGDVEAIASQSPKDLTRLIEQISGSLEYKAEYERLKAESEEAADQQTFQLNRRRGINSEIKQYQEQKREAENYARKADERDQAIITHVLWKLYNFQRLIEESSAEIQKHQEELKEFRRGVAKYERNLEEAKKEHAQVGREVSKAERLVKQKDREIEEKTNSLVPIDEKINVSTKKLTKYASRIAEIGKERDSQNGQVKQLEKDLKVVEKAQAQWDAEWKKAASKKGGQLSDADLQQYNTLKQEVNKRSSTDQIKVDDLRRQRTANEGTVSSLKSNFDGIQWQVNTCETELNNIKQRRDETSQAANQTSKDIDGKKSELNRLISERLRVSQKRTELEEKLQEVLKKLVEADDGRKQTEKEARMKETISTMKRIFPGVKGRISELCKPKQKKYADAVSTVLGRHFDAIVTDTERTAKECIQYLRDQRSGQATFIPLDTIQVKAANSNLKGMHRGMRPAIDTVDFDQSVSRAITYACGNSIICDDLSIAKFLCYDKSVDAKAVTLDGTVIHKGGLMTGGRGRETNSRRWEDADVENLSRLKDKLLGEIQTLPNPHRRGSEEEMLQGELSGLEQKQAYVQDQLSGLEKNHSSKKKEFDNFKRQLKEVQPKFTEKQRALESLDKDIEKIEAAVNSIADKVYHDFCRRLGFENIRDYEAQQGSLQQEAAKKKLEFSNQKSRLENQMSFERQRLKQTEERIQNIESQDERDRSLIDELNAQREAIQDEINELSNERDQLDEALDVQKDKYTTAGEKLADQRREVQKRSKNVEGTLRAVNALEAEIQRNSSSRYTVLRRCKLENIAIPLAEGSTDLDQLPIDELLQADPEAMEVDGEDPSSSAGLTVQDYGIEPDFDTLEDLRDHSDPQMDEQLQEKIRSINAELDKMAPNMRAMDRLDTVEAKFRATEKEFEDSRKDYIKKKEAFNTAMRRRSELFNKAFTHISDQISSIYKDLTRSTNFPIGGQAYLDIEDSDEPYLDGIKYHAMPPLKRFRDMEHLSGGEKTMAALALLFAVHSYQPSPFFVLDEVDAALDNANVAKIANYIRDHAGPGMQFIVISLKTGLFQQSEALVGIYRDQGANSSKSLTLDLRKYQ